MNLVMLKTKRAKFLKIDSNFQIHSPSHHWIGQKFLVVKFGVEIESGCAKGQ